MRRTIGSWLVLGLCGAWTASATDYWDATVSNDNSAFATSNEMYHGVSQQHDLETNPGLVADEDWYLMYDAPRSSYEAILDSAPPEVNPGTNSFQRFDDTGTVVIQSAEGANVGSPAPRARALRWQNTNATFTLNFLRVGGADCGVGCGSSAQYHIRFHDTTVAVPRFNNAGSQTTVLIIQNSSSFALRDIAGTVYFWSTSGALLGSSTFSLPAKAALVLNTAGVTGVAGQGGTITIAHDGGYGGLTVKSVALEPSTGFSFDSPGVYKPL